MTLSKEYGWDPKTGQGWTDDEYQSMIQRLKALPAHKIFYVELSEMIRPRPPLFAGSEYDQWARDDTSGNNDQYKWLICARPVPFIGKNAGLAVERKEDMGDARCLITLEAILSTGYKGT